MKGRKQKKNRTLYQMIAEKRGCTDQFVGKIARGERIPKRGIGLLVLNDLNELDKVML